MNRKFFLLLGLISLNFGFSQTYYNQFLDLFQKHYDAKKIEQLLTEWHQKDAKDIQYYISGYNFYLKESKKEILRLDTKGTNDGEQLVLKDSLNKTAGYMYSEIVQNDSIFAKSQALIDEGIKLYPKRLDLRFGKIFALGDAKKYDAFTNEILNVIQLTKANNFDWLWDDNKPLEDAINFFKSAIQDYENTLFNERQDPQLKKVALAMRDFFPDDPIAISTLGSSYLIDGNYPEALQLFTKAIQLSPDDTIIMNNLGETYARLKDYDNAKKYFTKMIAIGDEETKKYAEAKLKKLEENLINKK